MGGGSPGIDLASLVTVEEDGVQAEEEVEVDHPTA